MKIKDEIAACRMTMQLWSEVQMNDPEDVDKDEICFDLFGYLMHSCPCCEYAKYTSTMEQNNAYCTLVNCEKCPMKCFWSLNVNIGGSKYFNCTDEDSPYGKWEGAISDHDYDNSRLFAQEVAELAEKAMQYWEAMKEMNVIW